MSFTQKKDTYRDTNRNEKTIPAETQNVVNTQYHQRHKLWLSHNTDMDPKSSEKMIQLETHTIAKTH